MQLDALIATGTVMLVGAATPGPNNLLAMRAGARGPRAVVRVIVGVVLGSLAVIAAAWLAGAMLPPWGRDALAIAGGCYLGALGIAVARGSSGPADTAASSIAAIALLQLANPKAWTIALAITAPLERTAVAFAALLAITVAIPAVCLAVWAAIGRTLGQRRWLDVASGALLIAAAVALVLEGVR
jgi:threonine/homoserine/homoserine lactone efflux protein